MFVYKNLKYDSSFCPAIPTVPGGRGTQWIMLYLWAQEGNLVWPKDIWLV